MEKIICEACGADLKEVGVYTKIYTNYSYNNSTKKFVFTCDDIEGVMCKNCDAYVDTTVEKPNF